MVFIREEREREREREMTYQDVVIQINGSDGVLVELERYSTRLT